MIKKLAWEAERVGKIVNSLEVNCSGEVKSFNNLAANGSKML